MQYVAAIQLSQLENEFLTLETSEVISFLKRPPRATSATLLLTLHLIAVVMCGIFSDFVKMDVENSTSKVQMRTPFAHVSFVLNKVADPLT